MPLWSLDQSEAYDLDTPLVSLYIKNMASKIKMPRRLMSPKTVLDMMDNDSDSSDRTIIENSENDLVISQPEVIK